MGMHALTHRWNCKFPLQSHKEVQRPLLNKKYHYFIFYWNPWWLQILQEAFQPCLTSTCKPYDNENDDHDNIYSRMLYMNTYITSHRIMSDISWKCISLVNETTYTQLKYSSLYRGTLWIIIYYTIQYNSNLYSAIIPLKVLMYWDMNIVKHVQGTDKDNNIN